MVKLIVFVGGVCLSIGCFAFESTKVIPKGVRNITFKNAFATIGEKTNGDGHLEPLSEPMTKDLTFRRVLSGEANVIKRKQIEAFLLKEADEFQLDDSLGTFGADLKARVDVFAPIFAYGLTESITLALAVPFYHMSTNASLGFTPDDPMALKVLTKLNQDMRQTANAHEVHGKISTAVSEAYKKMAQNNVDALGPWEDSGVGDMTLALKHRFYQLGELSFAYQTGVVLPTGQTEDPRILTDLPMGDGQWDVFFQLASDQTLFSHITFNQYAKYTYQAPGRRSMRLQTEVESILVGVEEVDYKLGDFVDAGASVLYEPPYGLITGLGVVGFKKFGDDYRGVERAVSEWISRESEQEAMYGEARIGYSTVPAFRRGEFKLPLAINLDYKAPLVSRHRPLARLVTLDVHLYF